MTSALIFYFSAPVVLGGLFFITVRIIVYAVFWGWRLLIDYLRTII